MLRRWDRIQHAIIESFPARGTKPQPIWSLYELEPDDEHRAYLQRKITRLGATEHDFLRWRNACVAYSLPEALDALRKPDTLNMVPMNTPLWVTTHLLRRKAQSVRHVSIAIHLALVAVPSYGPLVSAYDQPLLLALEEASRHDLTHVLPALVSRILALPRKHHAKILAILCNHQLPSSPLAAISLQMVLNDINARSMLLPSETWRSIWDKWVILHPLGDNFTASLRLQIKDQGFQAPYHINKTRAYTQKATYFPDRTVPSRHNPTLAALTAAAYSKQASPRLLLSIASMLADGFFNQYPNQGRRHRSIPSVTFLTALILGLVRKRAYSRAVQAWKNAENNNIDVTPKLLEAVLSAYILSGNFEETVKLLDMYTKPFSNSELEVGQRFRLQLSPKIITLLVSQLPAAAKHTAFRQAYRRWGIQPDSNALEAVMLGAAEAVTKESQVHFDISRNMQELKEGLKNLFRSQPLPPEPPLEQDILLPGPFDKRHSIRLFRNVLIRNWPFIGGVDHGYWKGPLDKQLIQLFIPVPLSVRHRTTDDRAGVQFHPSPLHPSPTPSYPHACPTRRAWTAYLSMIDTNEVPGALGWMRSADEFLRIRPTPVDTPLDLFRPERAAIIDVLIRWEDAILSGEIPIERAWQEIKERVTDGVGEEGALRSWLIDWLGDEYVPSRSDVAKARIRMKEAMAGSLSNV
ncbi:unnamed protein product [Rhizoctonia solani]|uniref:Uncharacterized protein n=1 Tax=Rhizoctonia solani TaxID=456999 RepID=A0A8H2ZXG5_9AGAM|nr:unnamed protein product [Rhizoctonia solani]